MKKPPVGLAAQRGLFLKDEGYSIQKTEQVNRKIPPLSSPFSVTHHVRA